MNFQCIIPTGKANDNKSEQMKKRNYGIYKLAVFTVLFLITSCKSTKSVVNEGKTVERLPAKRIVQYHNANKLNFSTIRGRIKVAYQNGEESLSHSLSFRMEKDKAIWMSAALSLAKVYITPNRVTFYNKLQNEYFDGDFSYLSQLLGTELDFEKVQNMLLGNAIFDLEDEKFKAKVVNNGYELKPTNDFDLFKRLFLIEPYHYKMALQQISQPQEKRILNINYGTYQKIGEQVFPDTILITAADQENEVEIKIDYKSVEFNKPVSFPYKIPKGYKEIVF